MVTSITETIPIAPIAIEKLEATKHVTSTDDNFNKAQKMIYCWSQIFFYLFKSGRICCSYEDIILTEIVFCYVACGVIHNFLSDSNY